MVVTEALELPTVGLACAPEVTERVLAVGWTGHSVHDVVLGLVLQAAVVVQRPGGGAEHDVVLEQVLAGGDIAVEEVCAAVVGPAVGEDVVVQSDVGEDKK